MHIGAMRSSRNMLLGVCLCVSTVLVVDAADAQSPARPATTRSPVGTFRGTSTCLVRPSACHDEVVVYRIAPLRQGADSVSLDARKIVNGQEEEMGVLPCRFTSVNQTLTCEMPRGTWEFRLQSDSLVGELLLADRTKFRDVRTVRARRRGATPCFIAELRTLLRSFWFVMPHRMSRERARRR